MFSALDEYLCKEGYLVDCRPGGIISRDGFILDDGTVVRPTKILPAKINGKWVFDPSLTLEEFLEWERSQSEDLLGAAEDLEDGDDR